MIYPNLLFASKEHIDVLIIEIEIQNILCSVLFHSMKSVTAGSQEAATIYFIWDEASMAHSHNILAVGRMMIDITKSDIFFRNEIIILGGDS